MSDTNHQENNIENKGLDDSAAAVDEAGVQVPQTPEEKIAELEAQVAEFKDQFLRARADVENAKKRSIEEVAKAHKFAIESFAEHLLPVLDSLNAALADTGADPVKMKEGVELTLKQLLSAFERGRVQEINPVGEKFEIGRAHV